ncbi:MAG: hypothetical protein RLZ98_245 [Pseudomonadota bacterium]|jgi:hypothetical protein
MKNGGTFSFTSNAETDFFVTLFTMPATSYRYLTQITGVCAGRIIIGAPASACIMSWA